MTHRDRAGATAPFAAVVYPPRSNAVGFLGAFAKKLKRRGVRVGGIVQEMVPDPDGAFTGIDAIDVATGARAPIKRVARQNRDTTNCALDASVLVGTSGFLRDAIEGGAELIVFDKFGTEEQNGRGLSNEILLAISEGIPLLISVPQPALDIWQERTGAMGGVLPLDAGALEDWWTGVSFHRSGKGT
jgi:nucleoside-triphosphatase THEP1